MQRLLPLWIAASFTIACAHVSHPVPLAQLPREVVPAAYDITLSIDPQQERFSGDERIAIKVNAPTDVVWMHGRNLDVTSAIYSVPGRPDLTGVFEQVNRDGVARLRFPEKLTAGDGTLSFKWSAPFDTTAAGAYRVHDGGEDYVFTQFESQDARKAFPGFDEPAFKTPFDLKLIVPAGLKVIGNTPIAQTTGTGGNQRVQFQPTVPLPTYLIAFAVGPFDIVEGPAIPPDEVRSTPIPLRGVATHGKGPLLDFALHRAGDFVRILERYFGIAYPFPKLDLIAVPDFAAGAMENAGAITFKEFLLLVDEKTAPLTQKRGFASVTMHELAHQWFGDLVTMKWWDDVWLNEAFATWMSARSVDEWDPAQKATLDLLAATQHVMAEDRLASARAIRQPVRTHDDVENAFDGITYVKGAAVITMFEHWVGAEKFRQGIHEYLTAHRFGNATSDDFLAAISHAAGQDVTAPFHTFLDQSGVPFLAVQPQCDGGQAAVQIGVSRYVPLGSSVDPHAHWDVPECLAYPGDGARHEQCQLQTAQEQKSTLNASRCGTYVMPNSDARGYYSFGLDNKALEQLVAHRTDLNERERLSLGQSIQAATAAGRLPYGEALANLIPFTDSDEWRMLAFPFGAIRFAREYLVPAEQRERVERVARALKLWTPHAEVLVRGPDDVMLFRAQLTFALEVARDPEARARATTLAQRFFKEGASSDPLDASFRDLMLNTAAEDAPDVMLPLLRDRLKAPGNPMLRKFLLDAIGHVGGDQGEAARSLMLDPEVRPSEVIFILAGQAGRLETRDATWNWLQAHYDVLTKRLPEFVRGRLPGAFAGFCTDERAGEVQRFFEARMADAIGGPRELAQTIEKIRLCAAQVKAHRASAVAFFSK